MPEMLLTARADTNSITFAPRARMVQYGDGRSFAEFAIVMIHRKEIVGAIFGPRRTTTSVASALKSARARVADLRTNRLFVIRVTRSDISNGRARDCVECAIANALHRNRERMGIGSSQIRVTPYGAWAPDESLGIFLTDADATSHLALDELPPMDCGITRNGIVYSEGMSQWAMGFDDWAESRGMTLEEWREERGDDEDELPSRPAPTSFVLNLDAFVAQIEGGRQG